MEEIFEEIMRRFNPKNLIMRVFTNRFLTDYMKRLSQFSEKNEGFFLKNGELDFSTEVVSILNGVLKEVDFNSIENFEKDEDVVESFKVVNITAFDPYGIHSAFSKKVFAEKAEDEVAFCHAIIADVSFEYRKRSIHDRLQDLLEAKFGEQFGNAELVSMGTMDSDGNLTELNNITSRKISAPQHQVLFIPIISKDGLIAYDEFYEYELKKLESMRKEFIKEYKKFIIYYDEHILPFRSATSIVQAEAEHETLLRSAFPEK